MKVGFQIGYDNFNRRFVMMSIFLLLVAFICLGLFARNYNTRVRLLVLCVAAAMVLYITLG
jgi:hypothetical protein